MQISACKRFKTKIPACARDFLLFQLLARAAFLHGAGLVHRNAAATHVGTVEHGDCLLCRSIISHFDEREPTGATRLTIRRNEYGDDFAGLGEELLEFLIRCAVRNATNKQLYGHAFVVLKN